MLFFRETIGSRMFATKLRYLPQLPGVYLLKDASGVVIYIGKAKALKKRVSSYFQKDHKDWKTDLLVNEVADFDYVLTKSEQEALLLEAQLIQQHQPRYNVLLKNGNPFLYLLITKAERPELELVRRRTKKGTYFGPFLQKSAARSAYRYLMDTFRLNFCNQKISQGCLKYHIGLCAGSCKEEFDNAGYLARIELVRTLLEGRYDDLVQQLKTEIKALADKKEFEQAARLHTYLVNIEALIETAKLHFTERKFDTAVEFALQKKPFEQQINPAIGKLVQEYLSLAKTPVSIDCFDISHFQSTAIVGSCVRFSYGVPDKTNFRHFRIRSLVIQNDYAALREIVSRRYKNQRALPDLIVIDGGKGQLTAVQDLFPTVEFVALAKREETIFSKNYPDGIKLDLQSEVGRMLIALRDYTHHFAVSFHRKKRADLFKEMLEASK